MLFVRWLVWVWEGGELEVSRCIAQAVPKLIEMFFCLSLRSDWDYGTVTSLQKTALFSKGTQYSIYGNLVPFLPTSYPVFLQEITG